MARAPAATRAAVPQRADARSSTHTAIRLSVDASGVDMYAGPVPLTPTDNKIVGTANEFSVRYSSVRASENKAERVHFWLVTSTKLPSKSGRVAAHRTKLSSAKSLSFLHGPLGLPALASTRREPKPFRPG